MTEEEIIENAPEGASHYYPNYYGHFFYKEGPKGLVKIYDKEQDRWRTSAHRHSLSGLTPLPSPEPLYYVHSSGYAPSGPYNIHEAKDKAKKLVRNGYKPVLIVKAIFDVSVPEPVVEFKQL